MSLLKEKIEIDIQEAELYTQQAFRQFPSIVVWLLALIVVSLIPAHYIAKSTSHKIWAARYKQGEVLPKPSFTNPQPPQISSVTVTTLGPGNYSAIVELSNKNLDLSMDRVPFSFVFLNDKKQEIYRYSDSLYLKANQTKYITAPKFSLTENISYANFILPETLPWQKRINIPTIDFTTSIPQTFQQTSPPAFVVQGDFVNKSPYILNKARLTFVLFDENNKIIGISQRDESTVMPFERRAYKQLWPNVNADTLARVEVSADTDSLDPGNLSAPNININSSSDLSHPAQGR